MKRPLSGVVGSGEVADLGAGGPPGSLEDAISGPPNATTPQSAEWEGLGKITDDFIALLAARNSNWFNQPEDVKPEIRLYLPLIFNAEFVLNDVSTSRVKKIGIRIDYNPQPPGALTRKAIEMSYDPFLAQTDIGKELGIGSSDPNLPLEVGKLLMYLPETGILSNTVKKNIDFLNLPYLALLTIPAEHRLFFAGFLRFQEEKGERLEFLSNMNQRDGDIFEDHLTSFKGQFTLKRLLEYAKMRDERVILPYLNGLDNLTKIKGVR